MKNQNNLLNELITIEDLFEKLTSSDFYIFPEKM